MLAEFETVPRNHSMSRDFWPVVTTDVVYDNDTILLLKVFLEHRVQGIDADPAVVVFHKSSHQPRPLQAGLMVRRKHDRSLVSGTITRRINISNSLSRLPYLTPVWTDHAVHLLNFFSQFDFKFLVCRPRGVKTQSLNS